MEVQGNWRFCEKCYMMFYAGRQDQGKCPTGGEHSAHGDNFQLPFDAPETDNAQGSWRFCDKCYVMFYAGRPDQGKCAAGGAHAAEGKTFVLPHDIPATPISQASWRFCEKCDAMFYDGRSDHGHCPAGGAHVAQGYVFVLPFGEAFVFSLDNFFVRNTRSGTVLGSPSDTDYWSLSVQVTGQKSWIGTAGPHDFEKGNSWNTPLVSPPIFVPAGSKVAMSYHIINNSQGESAAVAYLNQMSEKLLSAAATSLAEEAGDAIASDIGAAIGAAIGTEIPVPVVGTALGALAGWLVGDLWNILWPDCDGPVASAVRVFTATDLLAAQGHVGTGDDHPGINSPDGCGSNSDYTVAWHVAAA